MLQSIVAACFYMYREYNKRIIFTMSYEYDPTKINSTTTSTSSVNHTVANTGENKSSVNTVFSEELKKAAKELGITPEKYQELMNDPKFASLSAEDKVKYIKDMNSAKTSEQVQAESDVTTETYSAASAPVAQPDSAVSAEPSAAANTPAAENVEETAVPADTNTVAATAKTTPEAKTSETSAMQSAAQAKDSEVQSADDTAETAAAQKADSEQNSDEDLLNNGNGGFYNMTKFCDLKSTDKMYKVYVREYAKNMYVYGSGERRELSAWDDLSAEEQNQLIEKYDAQLKNEFDVPDKYKHDLLESRMIQLQTANESGEGINNFSKLPSHEQAARILEVTGAKVRDSLPVSDVEAAMVEEGDLALEALRAHLRKVNGNDDSYINISYEDIFKFANDTGDKRVNIGKAELEYLQEKRANKEELSELEAKRLEFLETKVSAEYLESFGTRNGALTQLDEAILQEESDLRDQYSNASTFKKSSIKANYAYEKYKDQPEKFNELIKDALECGKIEDAVALHAIASKDKNIAKALAGSKDVDSMNLNSNNASNLDDQAGVLASNIRKLEESVPQVAEGFGIALTKSASDEQMPAISAETSKFSSVNVQTATVDRGYKLKDAGLATQVAENIKTNASQEAINYMGVHADLAQGELENIYLNTAIRDDAIATAAVIEGRTVERMEKENQVSAFDKLHNSVENLMDKDDAIKYSNKLADSIPNSHKDNQLAMHKSILNSKYSEVQEHASGNIHKYDKSVQADALHETYKTGNDKAIDAGNLQVSKMDPEAVKAVADEIRVQVAAMEARHGDSLIVRYAKEKLENEINLNGEISVEEIQSKMESYIAELKNLSPAEQYKKISADIIKWPPHYKQAALEGIAKYNKTLLGILVNNYGLTLLTSFGQINYLTKNTIMEELLKTPSKQNDSIEYVLAHPGSFSSDILERCYELKYKKPGEDENLAQISKYHTMPEAFGIGSQSGSNRTNLSFADVDKYNIFKRRDNLGNQYLNA